MPHLLCSFLHVDVDADQAASYKNARSNQAWDCTMWSRFSTDFAYVQTGIYDYKNSGTTLLAISKKGSGLGNTLSMHWSIHQNKVLQEFMYKVWSRRWLFQEWVLWCYEWGNNAILQACSRAFKKHLLLWWLLSLHLIRQRIHKTAVSSRLDRCET